MITYNSKNNIKNNIKNNHKNKNDNKNEHNNDSINNNITIGGNYSYDDAFDSRVSADLSVRFGGPSTTAAKKKKWENPTINSLTASLKNRDVRVHDGTPPYHRKHYNQDGVYTGEGRLCGYKYKCTHWNGNQSSYKSVQLYRKEFPSRVEHPTQTCTPEKARRRLCHLTGF